MYSYSSTPHWVTRFWDAQALYRVPAPLYWLMVVLTLVVTLLGLSYHGTIRPLAAMNYLLGLFLLLRYGGPLRKSLPVWIALGALLIPIISWYFMRADFSDYQYADNPYPDNFLDKFIFLLLALILAGSPRNVMLVWLLAAAAVLMLPWTAGDGIQEWWNALQGRRTGFGSNPIRAGMFYGTLLIGCLVFYRRWVFRPGFSAWRFGLWAVLTAVAAFMTAATQTRSVFLALALMAAGTVLILVILLARKRELRLGLRSWGVVALLILVGVALLVRSEGFQNTLTKTERQIGAVQPFLQGDFEAIPDDSIGLRLQFWVDGASWVSERPLFGWGYRASRMVHQEAGNMFGDRYFRSMHNAFLDLQLSYGLAGSLLMTVFLVWFVLQLHAAWKRKVMPLDYYLFILAFLMFYGINSLFTSSWFISDSVYLWNAVLIGGAAFVYRNLAQQHIAAQQPKTGDSKGD